MTTKKLPKKTLQEQLKELSEECLNDFYKEVNDMVGKEIVYSMFPIKIEYIHKYLDPLFYNMSGTKAIAVGKLLDEGDKVCLDDDYIFVNLPYNKNPYE